MSEATEILSAMEAGEAGAADRLLPLLYDELRRLAHAQMAAERPGQTLDATALVHEAYVRLVGSGQPISFANRRHFFGAAAEAMRRILVENARRKNQLKHGRGHQRVELTDPPAPAPDEDLVALDEALSLLAREDPASARVVELRYFGGLSHEQVAETLGVTVYEARQKWAYARAWLKDALSR